MSLIVLMILLLFIVFVLNIEMYLLIFTYLFYSENDVSILLFLELYSGIDIDNEEML
mgnify:CR=1 FL=1